MLCNSLISGAVHPELFPIRSIGKALFVGQGLESYGHQPSGVAFPRGSKIAPAFSVNMQRASFRVDFLNLTNYLLPPLVA